MEKQQEQVGPPISSYVNKLWKQEQTKAIVDSLKMLNVTDGALVLMKNDKVLVIPEEAVKQLEQLGKMSLGMDGKNVYELKAAGVGREVNGNISVIDEFVLPLKDKVLAIKRNGNVSIDPSSLSSKISGEEWDKLKPLVSKNECVMSLLVGVVDRKEEAKRCIKLLKALEERDEFPRIFADPSMNLEKILKTDWEMIIHTDTWLATGHYENKIKKTPGVLIFDVHIHPRIEGEGPNISPGDVFNLVIDEQHIEWFGTLRVGRTKTEEFKFDKNDLLAFYSDMRDLTWVRKALHASGKSWRKESAMLNSFAAEFEESQKAKVVTLRELLKEVD